MVMVGMKVVVGVGVKVGMGVGMGVVVNNINNSIGREERRKRERAVLLQFYIQNHCYSRGEICFHSHCFYANPLQ